VFVFAVCFNSDGTLLVSIRTNEVIVWNTASGEIVRRRKILAPHNCANIVGILFNADDTCLACIYGGTSILILDAELICMAELLGHADVVESIAFSPCGSGSIIASCSNDRTIRIWDPSKNSTLATKKLFGGVTVQLPLTLLLGYIKVPSDAEILSFRCETAASCITYNNSGDRLLSVSWDNGIHVWSSTTGELLKCLRCSCSRVICCHPEESVAAVVGTSWKLSMWNYETSELIADRDVAQADQPSQCLAFSRDASGFLCASANTAVLYDAHMTAEIRRFEGHTGTITAIQFAPLSLDCGLR
jgi:WD40 repeat protein